MNSHYELKNFRVFGNQGAKFEIAPITILTGCNSSGKSSIIKSLILLKDFFEHINSDYKNGKPFDLNRYELLFNKGKHNLGTFDKTENRDSKSNGFTLSWTKYSPIINDYVDIYFRFIKNESNILNNGILESITVKNANDTIYSLALNDKNAFMCDLSIIKNYFLEFVNYAEYYQNLCKQLPTDQDDLINFNKEEYLYDGTGVNKEAIEHVVKIQNSIISRDNINELFTKCNTSLYLKHNTLFYVPILDWLDNVSKIDMYDILLDKINQHGVEDKIAKNMFVIIDDFRDSKYETLNEYYIFFENQFLKEVHSHGSSIENVLSTLFTSRLLPSLMHDGMLKGMIANNEKDDVLFSKTPTKFKIIYTYLTEFCCKVDAEFNTNVFTYDHFNSYQYIEAAEFDTAVLFLGAFLQDTIVNVPTFIKEIEFVDSVRANVQRMYSFKNQGTDFNELLLEYISLPMSLENSSPDKRIDINANKYKLGTFLRKWLVKFEIADDIVFETTSEGLGVLIYLMRGTEKQLLADVGYGITQLLSILIKIELTIIQNQYIFKHPLLQQPAVTDYRFKEFTLAIEEPETNLHPKFQSQLADLFVDAKENYNIHFIVETHSEYLIRKLQTLVAKKEIQPSDVSIQYIYNPDPNKRPAGKPQVEKINIKEDGRLDKPFGSGFFDEAGNLSLDLLTIKSFN